MKKKPSPRPLAIKKPRLRAQADINSDDSEIVLHLSLGPLKQLIKPAKKLLSLIRKP